MNYTVVDINTVVIDGITYVAVESSLCGGCDLINKSECGKVTPYPGCGPTCRADKRYVNWKKLNVKPSTTNKFTSINKKKIYKLNFKP